MGPVLKRNISMMYSMVDDVVFNERDISWFLQKVFNVNKGIRPTEFLDTYIYERSKVTGQHHTHLRPKEVLAAASFQG